MADSIEDRLERAIEILVDITEAGGYLKKDTKETMQEAVSTIRICFNEMKNTVESKNKMMTNSQNEKENTTEEDDSFKERQVSPSLGLQNEVPSNNQHLPPTSGEKPNNNSAKNLEERITDKINRKLQEMMEKVTLNLKEMIQEEIKNDTQENPKNTSQQAERREQTQPTTERQTDPATQNRDEPAWTEVVRRRRAPNPPHIQTPTIVGTKRTPDTAATVSGKELQAASRRAWLYIAHLHHNTTQELVESHLKKLNVTEIIECEEIQTKGSLKAFKVGIPLKDLQHITKPELWPEGTTVRRYRFFRHQGQGAILEN